VSHLSCVDRIGVWSENEEEAKEMNDTGVLDTRQSLKQLL